MINKINESESIVFLQCIAKISLQICYILIIMIARGYKGWEKGGTIESKETQ